MAQKWYQKATVQAALAGGFFAIVAAIITGMFILFANGDQRVIEIHVLEKNTSQPVEGALVEIGETSGHSNQRGFFSFSTGEPETDTVDIRISRYRYNPFEVRLTLDSLSKTNLFYLTKPLVYDSLHVGERS